MGTRLSECTLCDHAPHGPSGCGEEHCGCVFGQLGLVDEPLRLTYSPGGGPVECGHLGEPSVAQWARAEALHQAREWIQHVGLGPENDPDGDVLVLIDAVARLWARFIETGSVDE